MPQEMKDNVLKTFAQFPEILFIWKYESDDLDINNYKNVILSKWTPQNDLLSWDFLRFPEITQLYLKILLMLLIFSNNCV